MQKSSLYNKLIIISCILCNISQIPILFNNRIISLAYMLSWLMLASLMAIYEKLVYIKYFILPILFDIFCVSLYVCKGGYVSSDLFRPINLCTFIMLIGIWAGRYLNLENLKTISGAFILSSLVVAVYLYFDIFRGTDWASAGGYLYGSKNSAGQIFLTAIILTVIFYMKNHKFLAAAIIIFFVALIVMMKSRATLITLVLFAVYFVLFVLEKPIYKIVGIIAFVIVAILIFTNESLYNLYINQVILNNRDINDISAITSNRDVQYDYFIQNFGQYWLVGTGGTYIEAMPLTVLLSYGVIGGLPILLFSLFPLYIGMKNIKYLKYRVFCSVIMSLGIVMWVNGIFEEQSPFGPGVKCYFLWLVTGLFLGYKRRIKSYGREY